MKSKRIKEVVREGYAKIAEQGTSCCGSVNSCCGGVDVTQDISRKIGYTEEELKNAPDGANLGLGCGNPVALASLKEAETVLDLGSGAGFDSFLAAQKVGEKGRVIGVDMTPAMIKKAKENAKKGNYRNVEFRLGEIENLPLADSSVDVIISNCVINLSPDKERVFRESFRVLTLGGRLMISDIVLLRELPDYIRKSIEAYIGCLSGAIMKDEYIAMIEKAGFQNVKVINEISFPIELMANDPTAKTVMKNLGLTAEKVKGIADSVVSISIQAKR